MDASVLHISAYGYWYHRVIYLQLKMIKKTTALPYDPRKAGNKLIFIIIISMGREMSHGQAACGSISAHQASNYDLLNPAPRSGIHIKNNMNCRFWINQQNKST